MSYVDENARVVRDADERSMISDAQDCADKASALLDAAGQAIEGTEDLRAIKRNLEQALAWLSDVQDFGDYSFE